MSRAGDAAGIAKRITTADEAPGSSPLKRAGAIQNDRGGSGEPSWPNDLGSPPIICTKTSEEARWKMRWEQAAEGVLPAAQIAPHKVACIRYQPSDTNTRASGYQAVGGGMVRSNDGIL